MVSIQQPEHLPWLGFFDKVRQVDFVVLLDNVQFKKRYFENRNKIRTKEGWHWLTVPVITKGKYTQLINQVETDNTTHWRKKCWLAIHTHYGKAPFFPKYSSFLEQIYNKQWTYLVDLNEEIIRRIIQELGIQVKIQRASTLGITGKGTDLLLEICQKLNADTYLSGISGKDYLDESKFTELGIKVVYQEFYHPIYTQVYEPFIPCMSIIDLLFNHGDKSLDIIKGIGVERMITLFE